MGRYVVMEESLRLFAPQADDQLTPEKLGLKRYNTLVQRVIERHGPHCGITGLAAPVSEQRPDGGMRVELINPKGSAKVSNLRLVEPMVYWSRHVESALEAGAGTLILAPWFSQDDVLAIARVSMLARYYADQAGSDAHHGISETALKNLKVLGNGEFMMQGLALAEYVSEWNPRQWMQALRNTPPRQRKVYVKTLVKNIRFLPDETWHAQWIEMLAEGTYLESGQTAHQWLTQVTKDQADAG